MSDRFSDRHLAKVIQERDRANVILAHLVESLNAPEDTAWEHLPGVVRDLVARVAELEAADGEHTQVVEYLHYAHGIDVDREDDDFREWQQQYGEAGN